MSDRKKQEKKEYSKNWGGARSGSGMKKGAKVKEVTKVQWSTKLHPDVLGCIRAQKNSARFVETLVRNSPEYKEFLSSEKS